MSQNYPIKGEVQGEYNFHPNWSIHLSLIFRYNVMKDVIYLFSEQIPQIVLTVVREGDYGMSLEERFDAYEPTELPRTASLVVAREQYKDYSRALYTKEFWDNSEGTGPYYSLDCYIKGHEEGLLVSVLVQTKEKLAVAREIIDTITNSSSSR